MLRTVVIGASTGLGRCIGIGLAKRGGRVALLARSKDKLDTAAAEAGGDALAIACDATDEASCREGIAAAAEGLGGIDAVVYAAATGPLVRLENADAETWRRAFDVNVMGASLATAAALPHLQASSGRVIYISTIGSSYTPPWPGLAVYQVTKAGLDRLVEAWHVEHPTVGFTRLSLGDCGGGEGDAMTHFASGWDPDLATEMVQTWVTSQLITGSLIGVEHLVEVVDGLVRSGGSINIPAVTVTPRLPRSSD
ncbi:MAG: SDR family NAD(P)-dependent oxidoreductase [Candidatus Binatia bacterium]|nr:SDR family NAD(P)-dependent oxidoreductase [Candidatus Binatia bacterium]